MNPVSAYRNDFEAVRTVGTELGGGLVASIGESKEVI